jgi:hypothetical protein
MENLANKGRIQGIRASIWPQPMFANIIALLLYLVSMLQLFKSIFMSTPCPRPGLNLYAVCHGYCQICMRFAPFSAFYFVPPDPKNK